MNQTVKKIWNWVTNVLIAIVVILAIMLVGVRILGFTPYSVLSGSMEPKYPVGSLIYVKKADPSEIKIGDAITFVMNEDLVVATHEVWKIDEENTCFYTQGIANKDEDGNIIRDGSPVHYNNLLGKPVFCVPGLGYFSDYVTKPPGMYLAASGALILLILTFVPDWIEKADEIDKKKAAAKAEKKEN